MATPFQIREAARVLHAGGLIAYPTEAVYGLGCDPMDREAVENLLQLKRRPWEKGMILIAASQQQLSNYIQSPNGEDQDKLNASWPGPNTWLIPASENCPDWIRGTNSTVAVRVTAHPLVRELCESFGGPIVSTSANHAGKPPCRSPRDVLLRLGREVDYCLHGSLGGDPTPTTIRDLKTGQIIRA